LTKEGASRAEDCALFCCFILQPLLSILLYLFCPFALSRQDYSAPLPYSTLHPITPPQHDAAWKETPTSVAHLPQNKFEDVLRNEALSRASAAGVDAADRFEQCIVP
jgi:hypothetical protein